MSAQEAIAAAAGMRTLYPRLYSLALAIQEFEGYAPGTRAHVNKNPGNLRFSPYQKGTREGYSEFETYFDGLFALLFDLWLKCDGRSRTGLTPESSVFDLIQAWAPAADGNEPEDYAEFVVMRLGVTTDTKLLWFLRGDER